MLISDYAHKLLHQLVESYKCDAVELKTSLEEVRKQEPPPLSWSFQRPNLSDAIAQHVTRFKSPDPLE